jgi:plastocyanin
MTRLIATLTLACGLPFAATADELRFRLLDSQDEPLQHAVVTLAVDGRSATPSTARVTVAQAGQQFDPRVLVVARGSYVHFPNTDITQHHVYSFSEAKVFELELYSGDDVDPVLFDNSGIVALGCNIHDWMLGYVYVTDDPVFGVSDENGEVVLDTGANRAGEVTYWHPAAVNPVPVTVSQDTLERNGAAVSIRIDTLSEDPLDFEIDPLQHLFSGAPH